MAAYSRGILFKSTFVANNRCISTTNAVFGKKNVKKFPLFAFRWTKDFKERQKTNPDPDILVYDYGVKEPVLKLHGKTYEIPEKIPELVVPDLKDCKLKPYVSYKTPTVYQTEFTAKDLFDAIYSRKVTEDFKAGKLDEQGQPIEPSEPERLTADQARKLARKTGSDIFQ